MAWFGVPLPAERVKPPRSRPVGRVTFIDDIGSDDEKRESVEKKIYVQVRGRSVVVDTDGGNLNEEEGEEGGGGDGGGGGENDGAVCDSSAAGPGSGSSGRAFPSSSSSSSSPPDSSKATTVGMDTVRGNAMGGKGNIKGGGGGWGGGKVAAFGSWLGRNEQAKGDTDDGPHQTKRKWITRGQKKEEQDGRDGGDINNVSHPDPTTTGDAEKKSATKSGRRGDDDGEPSARKKLLAPSSAAGTSSRSPAVNGGGSSVFSLNVSSRLRGRRLPDDPRKQYGKALGVVAEQEARTLLLRRARLRAQASNELF